MKNVALRYWRLMGLVMISPLLIMLPASGWLWAALSCWCSGIVAEAVLLTADIHARVRGGDQQ